MEIRHGLWPSKMKASRDSGYYKASRGHNLLIEILYRLDHTPTWNHPGPSHRPEHPSSVTGRSLQRPICWYPLNKEALQGSPNNFLVSSIAQLNYQYTSPRYPFRGHLCLFQKSVNGITYPKQSIPLCRLAKANILSMNI